MRHLPLLIVALLLTPVVAFGDLPAALYIFPAGGQRGTTVSFRVGGMYLHEGCPFEMPGAGVQAVSRIERTQTVWFEGPVIPIPDSQRQEDYPKDYAGTVSIAADASLGPRAWRVWTSQGAVSARPFIVGDLPEIVEDEIDGAPFPVAVKLPVTINGRIFPREDVDVWSFEARAGQSLTCAVLAGKLGSPLEPRVEILDPNGRRLAESSPTFATDAFVRFVAPATGKYQARIHDINFGGLQPYVYRLTVTDGPWVDRVYPLGGRRGTTARFALSGEALPADPVEISLPGDGPDFQVHVNSAWGNSLTLDLSDDREVLETEPNEDPKQLAVQDIPAVFNGRVDRAGDVDCWAFRASKGDEYEFDLRAARLGSPLDSVVILLDSHRKELARADDISNTQTDSHLRFKFSADGLYFVRVEERLASRGGPDFAYRLCVRPARQDYLLRVTPEKNNLPGGDALTILRGSQVRFGVEAERLGGFEGEIRLTLDGLPDGVTVVPTVAGKPGAKAPSPVDDNNGHATIPAKQPRVIVTLKADSTAKIQTVRLMIRGTATVGDKTITRTARARPVAWDAEFDNVHLAVALPTPFKVQGVFETKYAHRGSVFKRHYAIDRGGFSGPLTVELADKQNRHLQGVTGRKMSIPADATEFDYFVSLPPWMEIGRTSRSVVALVGEIEEPDGTKHKVSSTSDAQADQIIVLVDPERLSIELNRKSLIATAGETATVPVRIGRGPGMVGPIIVELIAPAHVRGIEAESLTIPPDQTEATLRLRFSRAGLGPFNMPLVIRATATHDGKPFLAESSLEVVTE